MLKEGMFIQERYEIVDKIGSGGMADVYKAKDHKLNRFVAVKVLKSEFREDTACNGTGRGNHIKRLYQQKRKTGCERGNEHCDSGFNGAGSSSQ